MKDVIIIGAGGHAAEIEEYINSSQKVKREKELKIIGFLDDDPQNYLRYRFSASLLGSIKNHKVQLEKYYIIGIANLKFRRIIVENFINQGAQFSSFSHYSAYISDSSTIGAGSIIGPNVNIGPNVKIGKYNLINSRCSLGHDSIIGDFNFISPNVCFSGFTKIGDENLFGINSASIPGIKVGNRNKIAAGMILDQSIGNENIVFYRFKEKIIAKPRNG